MNSSENRRLRHHRTAARTLQRAGALAVLALLVLAACGQRSGGAADEYYCPMHPTYVADRPGDCPICNMRLVKRVQAPDSTAEKTPHPAPEVHAGSAGRDAAGADDELPGHAVVTLDAESRRLAGVETAAVVASALARRVRTVGLVTPDESRLHHVHVKVGGFVEKLYITSTGQPVRAGEPAFSLYSQELLASQEEFLSARRAMAALDPAALPAAQAAAGTLAAAARRRLELLDVPAAFIAALEQSGVPQRNVTMLAHASGYVTEKNITEGQQVEPGMDLFTITDLSRVWVEADFYESEARLVQVGQRATVDLPYEPGRQLDGRVEYVYPYFDAATRTLKVRFAFPNPGLMLKPSMYVDVWLQVESAAGLVAPESAVLDTGTRQIVFVETAPGRFEPRRVQVGLRGDGRVQLLRGVQAGERLAIRANFLLDSESRLRGALSAAGDSSRGEQP